ncbi:MAG: tetratricopeptide repeat protein [Pseudomonadota bacterium]
MSDLSMAIDASNRGDHSRALELFQRVLTKEPENAYAHTHLSMCLLSLRRPFAALEETKRALAADPELALAHVGHARIATALNDREGARASIAEALRLDPTNADALVVRCVAALRDRDVPALREAATALLKQRPTDTQGHFALSRAASLSRDGTTAEKHARDALRIDPDDTLGHLAIGWAFWAQGDLARARDAGLSALATSPNSNAARELLTTVEAQRRPFSGWFYRIGIFFNSISAKKALIYVVSPLFIYMSAADVLHFLGYERLALNFWFGIIAVSTLVIVALSMYTKAMKSMAKSARLRRNY